MTESKKDTGIGFDAVFEREIEEIKARRRLRRLRESDEPTAPDVNGKIPPTDSQIFDSKLDGIDESDVQNSLVGLSFSGGGIRSATFCLGVVQALARGGIFKRVDYLSTVSGGGYIGSALSSLSSDGHRDFPFSDVGVDQPESNEKEDHCPALTHLRDNSQYLAPRGLIDLLLIPVVLLRGIIVNAMILLPYILAAVILSYFAWSTTLFDALYGETLATIDVHVPGKGSNCSRAQKDYTITMRVLGEASQTAPRCAPETPADQQCQPECSNTKKKWSDLPQLIAGLEFKEHAVLDSFPVGTKLGSAILADRQVLLHPDTPTFRLPILPEEEFGDPLREFDIHVHRLAKPSIWTDRFTLTKWAAGFGLALLVLFPLGRLFESTYGDTSRQRSFFSKVMVCVLIATAILAIIEVQPAAIHAFITIVDILEGPGIDGPVFEQWISSALAAITGLMTIVGGGRAMNKIKGKFALYLVALIGPLGVWLSYLMFMYWAIARPPQWFTSLTNWLIDNAATKGSLETFHNFIAFDANALVHAEEPYILGAFFILAVTILLYSRALIDVNRNSLHRFYRDHLSKAYLIRRETEISKTSIVHNGRVLLQELAVTGGEAQANQRSNSAPAPYHLINTALNIQNAKTLGTEGAESPNLRGRNASHFVFSPLYTGSEMTGYCKTVDLHSFDRKVNLGTAMTISGAAASPNMGAATLRPLVFIMGILNIRLGYWLPNPRYVSRKRTKLRRLIDKTLLRVGPNYLLRELFGLLNARGRYVNLSDGGHIENLGVYQLLRRKCRIIIAVDAEQDNQYAFQGLATVARQARIDFHYTINIENGIGKIGDAGSRHFAVGEIDYGPGNPCGWLIYIKASLTGNENVYIKEYKANNAAFPHQTTADQFFDETQFECYRALGEHAGEDFLKATIADLEADDHVASALLNRYRNPPVGRST